MKINRFLKTILLFVFVVLLLQGCRQEGLYTENKKDNSTIIISKITSLNQSKHKDKLTTELVKAKNAFQKNKINAKEGVVSYGNDISINTNQVYYIESNTGFHTYTFKISHQNNSENAPLENLVLTSLPDGSYREFLISYDLTHQEKQILMNGGNVNIKDKYTITELEKGTFNENEELTGKSQSCDYVEAQAYTWCSEYEHYNGEPAGTGPGECNADETSHLITVYLWVCESIDDDQDNGSSGGGYNPIGDNGIYTIPFTSAYYQYYETEDPFDPNYILYNNVGNFFASLGTEINQLRATNPDLFYYSFFYFKENGINTTTKNFITERLVGLNNWFKTANSNPNSSQLENQNFLNWAFKFLVSDYPDTTWGLFQSWFVEKRLDYTNANDVAFALNLSNVVRDLNSGQLNQLNTNWPNWNTITETMKTLVRTSIPYAVKYGRVLYETLSPLAQNPSTRDFINANIDAMRISINALGVINYDTNTMQWKDILLCWLFELGDFPVNNNTGSLLPTVGFSGYDYVISGNPNNTSMRHLTTHKLVNGISEKNSVIFLREKAISQIKQNNLAPVNGEWVFTVDAVVDTIIKRDMMQFCLGSYTTDIYIHSLGNNKYELTFIIKNASGWQSATRGLNDYDENHADNSVTDNKPRGDGIHLGGTIGETYGWKETITIP